MECNIMSQICCRFRLTAFVSDDIDRITVTLFTADILLLLEYACMHATSEIDLDALNAELQKLQVVVGIRCSRDSDEGMQNNPYNIVCLCADQPPPPPPPPP
ncbi:unnamed protein product [Cuscuta europaea]|uniref:Uncharacterized protein n=1 Tax=Cuscuta europaea TaxID=41803 RepID=A0A9P1EBH5_CUSEU|nr:unnamed protein product [Cuscuta europaea]